jgi:hypothetical protein
MARLRSAKEAGDSQYGSLEYAGLKLGFTLNHLFQGWSESLPGEDDAGTETDVVLVETWELIERGKPLTRRK